MIHAPILVNKFIKVFPADFMLILPESVIYLAESHLESAFFLVKKFSNLLAYFFWTLL